MLRLGLWGLPLLPHLLQFLFTLLPLTLLLLLSLLQQQPPIFLLQFQPLAAPLSSGTPILPTTAEIAHADKNVQTGEEGEGVQITTLTTQWHWGQPNSQRPAM